MRSIFCEKTRILLVFSQAVTQTHVILGSSSHVPSVLTPPQGPLRISFGHPIGQDIPVS